MGEKVDTENLIDAAGIAARLRLAQPQTVHLWRRRYENFPEPVAELTRVLVWDWSEVEAWARGTGRLE